MRKLLPYEHQLIEALGVSKEEYLDFLVVQEEYNDPKIGTALDIRNGPSPDPVTVSIILTVVGILFQVGAALLAPKPEVPDAGSRRNRQKRFAPSFGFNSAQDLAKYGDPLNLVYTNNAHNPKGNVRVNGSLLWSAIDSFGSSQFMRLVVALGASQIQEIDYTRTAFGQLTFSDLDRKSIYVFEGLNEPPKFNSFVDGFAGKTRYPSLLTPGDNKPAFLCLNTELKSNDESLARHTRLGYSQAYTPSSFTSLGVYDSIPINVNVLSRDKKGKTEKHNISVELKEGEENNNLWRGAGETSVSFGEGNSIVLYFDDTTKERDDDVPRKTAENMRRQMLEALDFSSTYILGAAKFRLDSYVGDNRILTDTKSVRAKFVCIEGGEVPSTPYGEKTPLNVEVGELDAIEDKFQETLDILNGGEEEERDVVLLEHIDADGNAIDLNMDINFSGQLEVTWKPEYTATVDLNFDPENGDGKERTVLLTQRTEKFPKGGSIDFTQDLREQVGAEDSTIDLTLSTREVRKPAKQQKKALKRLIDDINAGVFDGADDDIPDTSFSYTESIDSYSERRGDINGLPAAVPFKDFQFSGDFKNQTCMGVATGEIDNLLRNSSGTVSTKKFFKGVEDEANAQENVSHHYTFAYKDSRGVVNLFNFTGLQNTEGTDVFPEDGKLSTRRDKLRDTQQKIQDIDINTNTDLLKGSTDGDGIRTLISADALANQDPENREKANRKLLSTGTGLKKATFDLMEGNKKTEEKQINRINKRIETLLGRRRADAIATIEADIALLDDFLEDVPDDLQIKDRVGTKQIRADLRTLIKDKKTARDTIDGMLENWPDSFLNGLDNNFFTKCLVKAELATYSTVSPCNAVTFSFKSKLFRRISGRQKKYGDRKVDGYSESDNGIKSRMAFFKMAYRQAGEDSWNDIPHMFAVRHGSEADFYTQIIFYSESQTEWEFKFDPVFDVNAEINTRSFTSYFFLENADKATTIPLTGTVNLINFVGREVGLSAGYPNEAERGPYLTNEWDMFSVNSDTQVAFSFESGPEIALAAVTEQQLDLSYSNKYKRMQTMSLGVFAGKNIQDLRSVSTMVLKGKLCRTVESSGEATASSSYAPDIFVDTLLDKVNGVGKYVTRKNIDFDSLKTAKAFCVKNELFMDGVIADPGSWREFWVNAASFSLLELARKNGKDTLVPAFPVNESGEFSDSDDLPINVDVSALFTTGNILQDSYKEEFLNATDSTENLIASIVYRDSSSVKNFTANKSVNVKLLTKTASDENSRETFDLSQFVTRREQAIMFGKFLCNQRRHVRKGIEFRTLPSEAGLEPGDFIYVDVGLKNWDHYSSGMVMAGGALNSPLAPANEEGVQDVGSNVPFNFLLYQPSTGTVASENQITVTTSDDGRSTAAFTGTQQYEGWMFVMGEDKPDKRVFRVTELAIEEEGELSVKAVEYPCFEEAGGTRAHIADFRSSKFEVS
ncbi:MAG: hypothetical protein CMI60_13600 [Parvibaculum sp.]|nr:hypothetical protein [Parvibaculum sp.]